MRLDREGSSIRHGVPGVHGEVDEDLLHLTRVHLRRGDLLVENEPQLDVFAKGAAQQLGRLPQDLVDVHHRRKNYLLTREGQKLTH